MNVEDKIRHEIKATLNEIYFYEKRTLYESYAVTMAPGEFSEIFIEPFKNAIKNVFVELKKVTSEALTVLRLAFTLNQKKAEEIVARQRDRMAQFEKESEEIFQALGGEQSAQDYNMMMFLLAPGEYAFRKLKSAGSGAVDFAKQVGVLDKSIATATGEEAEEDALIRRREQDGPVKKLLRNLEQIFFLAHAEKSGNLLSENVAIEAIAGEIFDGPLGKMIQEQRSELEATLADLIDLIESIAAQNAFLSVATRVDTAKDPATGLSQMEEAIARLRVQDPEAAKQFENLPKDIRSEASALAKDKKFQEEIIESEDEPGPEDPEIDFSKHALNAVMGAAFGDTIGDYFDMIEQNKQLLDNTISDALPVEITSELLDGLESIKPGIVKSISTAEKVLGKNIAS